MSGYFLLSSHHKTKLQLSDKNISTHTLSVQAFFISLQRALQKGNQQAGQNRVRIIGAYRVAANSL